jgi:hypothetical protein
LKATALVKVLPKVVVPVGAVVALDVGAAATATVTIRNYGDDKNRITATVDAYGNRSNISTDLT